MRENAVLFMNFVISGGGTAERLYRRKLLMSIHRLYLKYLRKWFILLVIKLFYGGYYGE